jgi:uncharacterized membrane protein YtjA (UPF0391 family)
MVAFLLFGKRQRRDTGVRAGFVPSCAPSPFFSRLPTVGMRLAGEGYGNTADGSDWRCQVLYYAAVFLVIALIAALLGFGGIAAGAAGIAKIIFYVFLVIAIISLITGLLRR